MAPQRIEGEGRRQEDYIGLINNHYRKEGWYISTSPLFRFSSWKMEIGENVLQILREAGPQGLHVTKISLHVYNGMNSLFEQRDFEEVHHRVNLFLIRQAKKKSPLVIRLRRGVYKINRRTLREMELLFKFKDASEEEQNMRNMAAEQGQTTQENLLPLF